LDIVLPPGRRRHSAGALFLAGSLADFSAPALQKCETAE
jgi:hypothetical protein